MKTMKSLFAISAAILALTSCGNSDTTEVSDNGDGTITLSAKGVDYDLIQVEAGSFKIGATSEMKDVTPFEEEPMHDVTLTKNYYLGKTEVTQELWDAVMGTTSPEGNPKNLPVVNVSWEDCQQFIKKLNQMSGKQFRLPTEAEWEYAARGGSKSKRLQHSGSIYVERVAWYRSNSEGTRHQVGTMDINELGFHDLCGNVWEWCQDGHVKYPDTPQTDPCAPADSTQRYVIRGGGWNSGPTDCRYTSRSSYNGTSSNADLGFRLAL
ncbi:MAG: formylglycine-generating enzyme family protein [Prevotella sp.]|nr:formylglycine-generating enzyme family protein [Prevotella sp.]